LALLVTAGLLVESFRQLRAVDTGFRSEEVVTGKIVLPASRYADATARIGFVDRLLEAVRSVPGVTSAGVSDAVPLADNRQGTSFARADQPPPDRTASSPVSFAYVTDGFFETLGMRVIAGRTFTRQDQETSPRVVVINQRLARRLASAWRSAPAPGRCFA
jgi:hypothetical protein